MIADLGYTLNITSEKRVYLKIQAYRIRVYREYDAELGYTLKKTDGRYIKKREVKSG